MTKLCKDCEEFKIISVPYGYEWGQAICKKYNLITDYKTKRKFKTLYCIKESE